MEIRGGGEESAWCHASWKIPQMTFQRESHICHSSAPARSVSAYKQGCWLHLGHLTSTPLSSTFSCSVWMTGSAVLWRNIKQNVLVPEQQVDQKFEGKLWGRKNENIKELMLHKEPRYKGARGVGMSTFLIVNEQWETGWFMTTVALSQTPKSHFYSQKLTDMYETASAFKICC